MTGSNKEFLENVLEFCVETRRFEIENFWRRSLFFWGFIAAALILYGQVKTSNEFRDHWLLILIAGSGAGLSLAWYYANRGSKRWQAEWERKVDNLEDKVFGTTVFRSVERLTDSIAWNNGGYYSVSKIVIVVSLASYLFWLSLLAIEFYPFANAYVSQFVICHAGYFVLVPTACPNEVASVTILGLAELVVIAHLVLLPLIERTFASEVAPGATAGVDFDPNFPLPEEFRNEMRADELIAEQKRRNDHFDMMAWLTKLAK